MNGPGDSVLPSLSDYDRMSAVQKRRSLAPYEDKVDAMKRAGREAAVDERKRAVTKKRSYLDQNFSRDLEIKDTEYPPFAPPGETGEYEDIERGPHDPEHWGLDGRWWWYHRYQAVREGVPLQILFK